MKLSPLLFVFSLALLTSLAHGASPFDLALQALQTKIEYKFQNADLLRRALTHPSFSRANNRALSILGSNLLATAASLDSLQIDLDISPLDLTRRIAAVTNVRDCAAAGVRLGLDKVVRVAVSEADSGAPSIVCAAFRAVLGAVALDSGKVDRAAEVFRRIDTKPQPYVL